MLDTLAENYRQLSLGILAVFEVAEQAHALGTLDDIIRPWARGELLAQRKTLESCVDDEDLDLAFTALAGLGYHYGRLRRQLFADMHRRGPEPIWRVAGTQEGRTLAVRATSQIYRSQPSYTLSNAPDGSPYTWDFTIIDGHSSIGFPVLINAQLGEEDHIGVEAPGLYGHSSTAYEQLDQGLRALGYTPHLQN